jgi:hypothetical protein
VNDGKIVWLFLKGFDTHVSSYQLHLGLQFTQQRMVPSFTSHGFKLIDIPKPVYEKIMNRIRAPLSDFESIPFEYDIDVIYNRPDQGPKFIQIGSSSQQKSSSNIFISINLFFLSILISSGNLGREVMEDLRHLHEEWAGGK